MTLPASPPFLLLLRAGLFRPPETRVPTQLKVPLQSSAHWKECGPLSFWLGPWSCGWCLVLEEQEEEKEWVQKEMTGYPFFLFGKWKQEAVLGRGLESRVFALAERTELGSVRVKMTMW